MIALTFTISGYQKGSGVEHIFYASETHETEADVKKSLDDYVEMQADYAGSIMNQRDVVLKLDDHFIDCRSYSAMRFTYERRNDD